VLTSLVLFATTFVVRALAARRAVTNFDTWGHLYFTHLVRAQRSGPFRPISMAIVGMPPHSVPLLWHWLCSWIPAQTLLKVQRSLSAVLEACFVVICHQLCLRAGVAPTTAAYACAFYLLTPMWFSRLAPGPRVNSLTPRLTSEHAVTLFFIILLFPLGLPAAAQAVLAIALGAFVVLSTKFGVQALLFLSPPVALLQPDWRIAAATVAAVAVALAATGGEVIRSLRQQLRHLAWYAGENQRGAMPVSSRNDWRALRDGVRHAMRTRTLGNLAVLLCARNSYTGVLCKLPLLLVAGTFLVLDALRGAPSAPDHGLWMAPCLAALGLFFAINRPALLFLGEAERYLNHVGFLLALGAASVLAGSGRLPWAHAVLAYGAAYWAWEAWWLHRALATERAEQALASEAEQMLATLQGEQPGTILCFPYHAVGIWRILLDRPWRTLLPHFLPADARARFEAAYGMAAYPYIALDRLELLAHDLDVTHVLLDRRDWARKGCPGFGLLSRWERVRHGGSTLALYRRPGARAPEAAQPPQMSFTILATTADVLALAPHRATYVYGAGQAGSIVRDALVAHGIQVAGFVTTRERGQRDGLAVHALDELLEREGVDVRLVVASEAFCEIAETLTARGVPHFYNALPLVDAR
jgi:hypothetical protein